MRTFPIFFVATAGLLFAGSCFALPIPILPLPPLPPIVTGSSVPAAPVVKAYTGETVIGGTNGSVYGKFKVPQPNALEGTVVLGKKKSPAIFSEATVVVFEKGTSPGLAAFPHAIVSSVGQPNGDAALIKIKDPQDGIGAANNTLLVNGLTNNLPTVVAQTGTPGNGLPAGVKIKKFLAFDDTGTDPFFLALLSDAGAAPASKVALCAVTGTTVHVLLQKGDAALDSTVTGFRTLVGVRGSLSDGRWRVDDSDFGVLLTLANRKRAEVIIPATATGTASWTTVQETGTDTVVETGTGGGIAGATIKALGVPGFGTTGAAAECLLTTSGTAITAANDVVLITSATATATSTVLARKGGEVNNNAGTPINGVFYTSLGAPLSGALGAVAFQGTVRGNGVTKANRFGIWYASNGTTPELVARTGDAAVSSGTNGGGGHYASFRSLALPSGTTGTGPIFVAKLKVSKADGVTARNNLGLYAVDSTGTVDLLLRAGEAVTLPSSTTPKIVKSFVTLVPAPGSVGAENTFDDTGKVTEIATFTDKTQALLKITVP